MVLGSQAHSAIPALWLCMMEEWKGKQAPGNETLYHEGLPQEPASAGRLQTPSSTHEGSALGAEPLVTVSIRGVREESSELSPETVARQGLFEEGATFPSPTQSSGYI